MCSPGGGIHFLSSVFSIGVEILSVNQNFEYLNYWNTIYFSVIEIKSKISDSHSIFFSLHPHDLKIKSQIELWIWGIMTLPLSVIWC